MKIPPTNRPQMKKIAEVSETDLLMAAAEMHEMGRLVLPDDQMRYDVLDEKHPGAGKTLKEFMDTVTPENRRKYNLKGWEKQLDYNRDHPQTRPDREFKPSKRGRA